MTAIVASYSARLAVQIMSAEKPVLTVPTITNVAQAKCVVMATVCHTALPGPEVLLPAL